jgi:hypothetical protein
VGGPTRPRTCVTIEPEFYPWLSLAFICWGVLDCFFGYRVFKITLALFGGLAGALLLEAAARQLGADPSVANGAMLVGAVLGAVLAFLLYLAAVFIAGFGFGATLGVLLLAHFHHTASLLAGVVLGVVGGFLALKVQRVLIILSTATLGSFRALLALSYFTSRIDWVFYFRQPDQLPALIENHAWMFPSILVLAAVGAVAQLELGGKDRDGKKAADKD